MPFCVDVQWRLKYCTSRSCCFAAASEEKVPRLRRFPEVSFLREYKRYWPDLSFLIMFKVDAPVAMQVRRSGSIAPSEQSGNRPDACRHHIGRTSEPLEEVKR